ncbi:unnamed protein product, partial [Onchocerca ochengi]
SNTVTRNDEYPLYRRSAEDGGKLATTQMWNGDIKVDNRQLGMSSPNRSAAASFDIELHREQNYNTIDLSSYLQSNIPKLTFEQKGIYDQIMQTVNKGVKKIFFLDAPGGTGKMSLIKLVLAAVRSQNDIALALASSRNLVPTLLLVTSKEEMVEKVFLNIQINYKNHDWLSERAILAAKNKDADELNNIIQSNIQSETVTCKSVDTVVEADEAVTNPTEFFYSLDLLGLPPHKLQLKIGVPIIVLRNINQPNFVTAHGLQ